MSTARRHRFLAACIALLAAWALALVPTLSRALASQGDGGQALVEVCSAHGVKLLVAGEDGQLVPTQAGNSLDHCAHCGLAATPAAPPSAQPQVPVEVAEAAMPAAFWHAPKPPHPWRAAQPRAPPTLS